jgi:transposase
LAEQQERIALSLKERDRLKVLAEVEAGQLVQREAAARLGMSERGFRKLLKRYRTRQDAAVVHGLRGRRSNRRLPEAIARKAVAAVEQHYRDFGPTLAAEYLAKERGIELSRETLRQLLIQAGIWKAAPQQVREVHQWRPRRSCCGELVQWDTSVHAWLEDRGPEKM